MKGIILAGGKGSRLDPLTRATNKHLLPVFDKPMVYYPIQTLVKAGVTDIMVVTGGAHAGDFIKVLRNGECFGLSKLHYAYQEGEGGIADALQKAESFVGNDSCMVVLGDNLLDYDFFLDVKTFKEGATVFTKEVSDPERFGVLYEENGKYHIVEKPENPVSSKAVIGVYMYDNTVFDRIRTLVPSGRGELEVTDLNNSYAEECKLTAKPIYGSWLDCGTHESLARATKVMLEK